MFVFIGSWAERAFWLIEPQFRFARAFVRAVAGEASIGKQRTDIAIETNFRAAERDGDY